MGKIITIDLPHDLPENWSDSQYVSPGGLEVGLTERHGYNYLMKQVNNAQLAILELDDNASSSGGGLVQGLDDLDNLYHQGHYLFLDMTGIFGVPELMYDVYISRQVFDEDKITVVQTATRVYCGPYTSVSYQRVYYYANTQATNGWTPWKQIATITDIDTMAAPRSLIYGEHTANSTSELSSKLMDVFRSMADTQVMNFRFNCTSVNMVLDAGVWIVNISRVNDSFGAIVATKYVNDAQGTGALIKTCSIHSGSLTNWGAITPVAVYPATLEE